MFDKRNIRIYYLRTLEKIRSFLLSRNSREFLIFLFFVFVSFCFIIIIQYLKQPKTERNESI